MMVSPGFPPDKTGGIENYVRMMYSEMRQRGHRVSVLTQLHRKRIPDPWVHQIPTPSGEASGYAVWALKGWVRASRISCDLIHFNGFPGNILSLTPLRHVPKVIHVHNSLTMEPGYFSRDAGRHKMGYMIAARAYRNGTLVIAPTHVVKEDLIQNVKGIDKNRIKVIPNCIDTGYYRRDGLRNQVRERYSLNGKFVILYFGKVKRTKGIETICKAYQMVKKKIDAALIIGGAGTATNWFLNYLKETYRDVIFTGYVEDPRQFYAAADVFSIYTTGVDGGEVFPIALLEAMSMGLPVACTDSPLFREITKGNAYYGQPESPESLAEVLLHLAKNSVEAENKAAECRKLAEREYDSHHVADKLELAYQAALE